MRKSSASTRFLKNNPYLNERRFGLPFIGTRDDEQDFNPVVGEIADAINFYGYEVRDENIAKIPDVDLGTGNPVEFKPFPLSITQNEASTLKPQAFYRYPYTEGADDIREELLAYLEKEGFVNTTPLSYDDVDSKGLSVHNLTFSVSSSIIFNLIISTISKPNDVVLMTSPIYGLFAIRAERSGANVHKLDLEKEDNFFINPSKLAKKIDEINESLKTVYNDRLPYTPRVVAFFNENPHNPTGRVMGKKQYGLLCEIAKVCRERGVFVIDDIVYRDITYDEENIAVPIATIPGEFTNTITMFSLSKSYGLASLRAGFIVADEPIIRELINKTFQILDSAPDLNGRALAGAFNTTPEREIIYNNYFNELRKIYMYKFNLLKSLVSGLNTINPKFKKKVIKTVVNVLGDEQARIAFEGLPLVEFPKNLPEPEAGFFAILDFTKLKGRMYNGKTIRTEEDLLKFFYETYRIRFLVGQSISWPYKEELVGRISFSIDDEKLVTALFNMKKAIALLEDKNPYIIRFNRFEDQRRIAEIKLENKQSAYDMSVSSMYKKDLEIQELTERYEASFDEYEKLVLVATKSSSNEIVGFSCFNPAPKTEFFDSELVSLYTTQEIWTPESIIKGELFKETCKYLAKLGKKNMVVWCLKTDDNLIRFYEEQGGKIVKSLPLPSEDDEKCAIYFHLG